MLRRILFIGSISSTPAVPQSTVRRRVVMTPGVAARAHVFLRFFFYRQVLL
jgi:hypothetical protein